MRWKKGGKFFLVKKVKNLPINIEKMFYDQDAKDIKQNFMTLIQISVWNSDIFKSQRF